MFAHIQAGTQPSELELEDFSYTFRAKCDAIREAADSSSTNLETLEPTPEDLKDFEAKAYALMKNSILSTTTCVDAVEAVLKQTSSDPCEIDDVILLPLRLKEEKLSFAPLIRDYFNGHRHRPQFHTMETEDPLLRCAARQASREAILKASWKTCCKKQRRATRTGKVASLVLCSKK